MACASPHGLHAFHTQQRQAWRASVLLILVIAFYITVSGGVRRVESNIQANVSRCQGVQASSDARSMVRRIRGGKLKDEPGLKMKDDAGDVIERREATAEYRKAKTLTRNKKDTKDLGWLSDPKPELFHVERNTTKYSIKMKESQWKEGKTSRRVRKKKKKILEASGLDTYTVMMEAEAEHKREIHDAREKEYAKLRKVLVDRGEDLTHMTERMVYDRIEKVLSARERREIRKELDLTEDTLQAIEGAPIKSRGLYNKTEQEMEIGVQFHEDPKARSYKKQDYRKVRRLERDRLPEERKKLIMKTHAEKTWWAWKQSRREKKKMFRMVEQAVGGPTKESEEAAKRFDFLERERVPRRTIRWWERWMSSWDEMGVYSRRSLLRTPYHESPLTEVEMRACANANWTQMVGPHKTKVMKVVRRRRKLLKNMIYSLWHEWNEPQLAQFLFKRAKDGYWSLEAVYDMLQCPRFEDLTMDNKYKVLSFFAMTKSGTLLLRYGVKHYVARTPTMTLAEHSLYKGMINKEANLTLDMLPGDHVDTKKFKPIIPLDEVEALEDFHPEDDHRLPPGWKLEDLDTLRELQAQYARERELLGLQPKAAKIDLQTKTINYDIHPEEREKQLEKLAIIEEELEKNKEREQNDLERQFAESKLVDDDERMAEE